jgi:hypothetical protein
VRKRRRVALPASVLDMAAAGQRKGQPAKEHLQRRVRGRVLLSATRMQRSIGFVGPTAAC